ncbi:MAG: hypothetical protein A3F11_08590 [Gammaproteobacteria bacterium RIFCSPHIGHO2_12_FULL_37_14]|nr:MAG: hypothetical protein A3F11_08590 [Gammaproteobacteria bacterium RIFCSPHIGHO2_12_FULL_37_14]
MMQSGKRESGITLLEMMLVLAIAAVLILMGLRQYRVLRTDTDVQQVRYNVDTLFQAAARYYEVNCSMKTDASGNSVPGELNPAKWTDLTLPYGGSAINVISLLRSEGFLTEILPSSPIVSASSPYIVQFVPHTVDRSLNSADGPKKIGTILIWNIQVIVTLRDASQANFYLRLLRGDCLGPANPSSSCGSTTMGTGSNIIFERLPSFASAQNETSYWPINPLVKQFKQMYTTYPTQYLLNSGGTTPSGEQYFLCEG